MIYVVSDIHGYYDKYIDVLNSINLQDNDTLYVLGDVVDKGKYGCKILLDMMKHHNIIPLLGNHDNMAKTFLSKLIDKNTDFNEMDASFKRDMMEWIRYEGKNTFNEFKKLSHDDRLNVLRYLETFKLYEEINVNNKDYILVHAGLDNFKITKRLQDYTIDEMIWAETDYDKMYFKDKILITGHTPVSAILFDKNADKIYKKNNHIAIDCGCGYGKKLGVLCLNTMEEMYF